MLTMGLQLFSSACCHIFIPTRNPEGIYCQSLAEIHNGSTSCNLIISMQFWLAIHLHPSGTRNAPNCAIYTLAHIKSYPLTFPALANPG